MKPKYIIITPAKNEEKNIEFTLKAVCSQTLLPELWLILNDNSTDNTSEIVTSYNKVHTWIKLVNVQKFSIEEYSSRIVSLFRYGISLIDTNLKHDYIVKLDADVSFNKDFCEKILLTFENNSKLGIASGYLISDDLKKDKFLGENTRGAAKFYRKKCFNEIGGLYLSRGWDVMDDITAHYKGWETKVLPYTFFHHKEEGKRSGLYKKHYYTGLFMGRVPYNPFYLLAKFIFILFRRPYLLASIIQLFAYIKARFFIKERPFPSEIAEYLRKEQLERLIKLLLK